MPRGGKRSGAGRPKGKGKYGETTTPIRVPCSLLGGIQDYVENQGYQIPLYSSTVKAGFPSPADDHIERHLDLNQLLIDHPAATFLVRASGDSMTGAGIFPGDILVVDRSLTPAHNKIVIAAIFDELTVKRLYQRGNVIKLVAENPAYPDIPLKQELNTVIWGVVTGVIRQV